MAKRPRNITSWDNATCFDYQRPPKRLVNLDITNLLDTIDMELQIDRRFYKAVRGAMDSYIHVHGDTIYLLDSASKHGLIKRIFGAMNQVINSEKENHKPHKQFGGYYTVEWIEEYQRIRQLGG